MPFAESLAKNISCSLVTTSISDILGGSQNQSPCLEAEEVT